VKATVCLRNASPGSGQAGGGFRHEQVIGASSSDGGEIAGRPVAPPGDLAATIYHHMGVPLDATYADHQGWY
jgi:hypothetical protein